MLTISKIQLKAMNPCADYQSSEYIDELFDGREFLDSFDVACLDIPAEDRVWAMIRMLGDRAQHLFLCDCAENAIALVDNPDPRSVAAIATKRRWIEGKASAAELADASSAASFAARSAARSAASSAARSAAYFAARSVADSAAAESAAYSAARSVADSAAAESAAYSAEREAQVDLLLAYHLGRK